MSLFQVKDWDVATLPISPSPSKKRKRLKNVDKVQSAQLNVEKLMRKVDKASFLNKHKETLQNKQRTGPVGTCDKHGTNPRGILPPLQGSSASRADSNGARLSKRARKKAPRPLSAADSMTADDRSLFTPRDKVSIRAGSSLTSLQANMKDSLGGARFRWINEVLYTTASVEGHTLMLDDPKLYEEYHAGFRQQVRSWPSNPVDHYISILSSYPRGTVIADLGCGEAALARTLIPKGYCVLSFDLVSDGAYVLEADVCQKIPLPGAENDLDKGQIVDVCVCALSLMSLDWIRCIRETWRVLRPGGELKIAEVTSRFTDVNKFIGVIGDLGFKLKSKDDSNTHFTLFEFRKVPRTPLNSENWDELRARHVVLKPCEYKRR